MLYYLMNKDAPVLSFTHKNDHPLSDEGYFEKVETLGTLPFNFNDIGYWIKCRKGSNYSRNIRDIMFKLGINNDLEYIAKTHAISTNDTFWIKSEGENKAWNDVSLFRNEFTSVISEHCFEGCGIRENIGELHSPELSCEGSFRKMFKREPCTGQFDSDIYIYKRGNPEGEESPCNFEPYSEMLASEIANIISPDNAVRYELHRIDGVPATKCNLFTSEHFGFVTYRNARTKDSHLINDIAAFYTDRGFEQQFRELLVIDSLCFNYDRHTSNFGFLYDTETMEIIRPAPIFDLNNTLFPTITVDELKQIGDKLFYMEPKIGEDFTRTGQLALDDTIREKLENMRDFSFAFRGDDLFSEERVGLLENIVRKQAEALLSGKRLTTEEVFPMSSAARKRFEEDYN